MSVARSLSFSLPRTRHHSSLPAHVESSGAPPRSAWLGTQRSRSACSAQESTCSASHRPLLRAVRHIQVNGQVTATSWHHEDLQQAQFITNNDTSTLKLPWQATSCPIVSALVIVILSPSSILHRPVCNLTAGTTLVHKPSPSARSVTTTTTEPLTQMLLRTCKYATMRKASGSMIGSTILSAYFSGDDASP